ncbi:helix-turn-helix transcriptional regulator [Kitasatospora kifunensis]|uniref:DNA-binding NarL/FixJ family response regulator n=1 Tax=Kitasatospora kifunensis TaxID=58351 RepID=A0A7W7VZ09_KITKI|nr:response regulator transcription factor [Kitasatospora kifunensis]MBB4927254.1 DNA-binding NarL/FixJ family response regulator [Kitasatospora kifunensis]
MAVTDAVPRSSTAGAEQLRVQVDANDAAVREAVVGKLRHGGIVTVCDRERGPGTVVVAAGGTVDEAIDACRSTLRGGEYRLLVVADVLSRGGVLRGVRVGARAMLQSTQATPERLVAAVHSAHHGEGRLPYGVLVTLLGGAAEARAAAPQPAPGAVPLTVRQTEVLSLMAEGHGNAAIARALSCSEHTVKNVIYELMARLQVRNRAHAVAHAVRSGLI